MRTRQKVIVSLLLRAATEPTRTQLMKWLFLLRQESPLRDDPTFYDFLPYRYGPFSFEAYRELDALAQIGILESRSLRIRREALGAARAVESALPLRTQQAAAETVARYGAWSTRRLREDVYRRYPWYASRSELRRVRKAAPSAPLAVYTVGYEGRSIDRFLDELLRRGMRGLIDVRSNPMSRKYGFSGNTLRRLARKVGIAYHHFPELGIPSTLRQGMEAPAARSRLLDWYEREILPRRSEHVEQVGRLLATHAFTLVCFEADARSCHRSRLGAALAAVTALPLAHL